MDDVAPSVAVNSQSRPLAMVNMAGTEGLHQRVFEAPLWCPSVTVAGGKLAKYVDKRRVPFESSDV